jgi:predicted RNA binding protein YcfA (HicA-like mRNA interferase family)
MPKLYSAKVVLSALQRADFVIIGQRGSHIKLQKVINERTLVVIVPNHKEVALGTFGSILRQAGMTKSQFEDLL